MSGLTRRRLLAASGAVAIGAVAGCTSSAEESDDGEDDDEAVPSGDGTILNTIAVENLADQTHQVDVIVEFDGEIEDWSTLDLEPGEGTDLRSNWPGEPSDFRVRARLDGETVSEVRPATWNNPDCLALTIIVDRDSDLSILSAAGEDACPR